MNLSVGKNTSNISKQSEKYIETTYAKDFFKNLKLFICDTEQCK